ALIFFFVYIYINRIRIIRQKSVSELEKFKLEKALQLNVLSSIRSQMNPHFIFNALNTIQSYIYLNDKKQAINYLGKFSILTRKILEESNRETITLGEEIETLDLYLQLEKMRFENTLEYAIELVDIRYPEQYKIPPMLIQPYVENAVKHGLMHKTSNRKIKITFSFSDIDQLLQVNIDDNGIGRKRSEEINFKKNAAHRSFSTRANKTRLDILNSDRINPISIRIIDKSDEYNNPLGTTVQINIPVL
ncbi:MAG: histidine kinase, partial [Bacteroidia bacterium]|nr:histidine kinase [Bacteroidia bacterium]